MPPTPAAPRAAKVDDVVDIMTTIDRQLPNGDGVRWFNHLYLQVTLAVRSEVKTGTYADPAFIERLDVVFANLYFEAYAAGQTAVSSVPSAWRPLFECRGELRIHPLQFALAGMNAHINRDLPLSIVATYSAVGGAPTDRDARYADFCRVNSLLEAVENQVRADYSTGIVAVVDAAAGQADSAAAMWKVRNAREAAWTNGEVLWTLRRRPVLRDAFFSRLDGLTSLAGRGLLVPVAPRL
jgi:hypothetical protein